MTRNRFSIARNAIQTDDTNMAHVAPRRRCLEMQTFWRRQ